MFLPTIAFVVVVNAHDSYVFTKSFLRSVHISVALMAEINKGGHETQKIRSVLSVDAAHHITV